MSNESTAGFRLSLQQKHLWVHGYTGPLYRSYGWLRLQGALDVARLRAAIASVIERHEILRTTFQRQAGLKVPVQVVHESLEPLWHEIDLSSFDETERKGKLYEAYLDVTRRSIDLELGPLVDLTLMRSTEEDHRLLIAIPSLCADAPTIGYLTAEIAHFYGGGSSEVEEDPIQYADYAEWQHELVQSSDDAAEADREYWREQERIDAPLLAFPYDVGRADKGGIFEPEDLALSSDSTLR